MYFWVHTPGNCGLVWVVFVTGLNTPVQAAPEPDELPFEKPLDVFNAIFNETDSEGEEMDAEEAAVGGGEEPPSVAGTSNGHRMHHSASTSQQAPVGRAAIAVSYTHLTLPTNREV